MAIGIAISVATFTPATWYLSAMYSAIYDGAVTNANGGSILDDLKSAGFSFASASVWHGTGSFLDKINADVGERIAVHGIVGGGLAVAEGGSFSDGFLSAAAGEALPTNRIHIGNNYTLTVAARTAAAGVVGGTVAAVSGGNFVNGAKTAAFAELFNDLSHETKEALERNLTAAGTLLGGTAGDVGGAAVGTLLEPVGGTVVGAGVGAVAGAAAGGATGFGLAKAIESLYTDLTQMFRSSSSDGTPSQARSKVRKGQGPREIERVDRPNTNQPGSQWHAHGENGGAVNQDGSIHDTNPGFSRKTLKWLSNHGWDV